MIYPIVEYAHKIGKNTADFTTMDMVNYTKWWMKQPYREDIIKEIQEQQQRAKVVGQQLQSQREGDKNMAKKHTTGSFQKAQTSRLAERGIESPINDGEEEIVIHEDTEVICSMELTKADVKALIWAIGVAMNDYNVEGEMEVSLKSLLEGLEGV